MTFLDSSLRPWKVAPFKTISHEGASVTADWLWRWAYDCDRWIPLRPWTVADEATRKKWPPLHALDDWQALLYEDLDRRMQP